MNPKLHLLLELIRLTGLIARSVTESNNFDFVGFWYAVRKLADTAIEQHTFRVADPEDGVNDDDL